MQGARTLIRNVTEPLPGLESPSDRVRAKSLAQLLLVAGPCGMLAITVELISDPTFLPTFIVNTSVIAILLVTSQLARTRHYRAAAALTMVVVIAACVSAGLFNPGDPVWWAYTSISVIGGTLLLSLRAAVLLALLSAAAVAAVLLFQEKTGQALFAPLGWQLVIFPLLLVITRARNRLEEQRAQLQAELEQNQRLELVGRMAGGIAHDFNNLLTIITTSSELARDLEGDDLHEVLDHIDDARVRAAQLTQQLLAFSRRQLLRPTAVDLDAVVRSFTDVLRIAADKSLTVEFMGEPLVVLAEASQLEQVLLNLVVNARDAIDLDGRIVLRLSRLDAGPKGSGLEGRACACLQVSDDGAGIPVEVLPHIFEPFFTTKTDPGSGTNSGGSGLGLSTVHGIVRQHQGHVEVKSRPGEGTTVRVFVPLMPPMEAPATEVKGDEGLRVLLVDDDEQLVRVLARALETMGHRVCAVSSVDGALERIAAGDPFDLIVSDVQMPKMRGPELLRAIREQRPGIPALLITGYAPDADYRDLDDVEVLQKPVALAVLDDAMRRVSRA